MPVLDINDYTKLKDEPRPGGVPRYKRGDFPTYDVTRKQLEEASYILNDKLRNNNFGYFGALSDEDACRRTLLTLEGDENGMWFKDNTIYHASIPLSEQGIADVMEAFHNWQADQIIQGKALFPPKNWPDDLLEKRLKAEARLDVNLSERAKVLELIEKFKQQAKQEKKTRMLEFGPVGLIKRNPNRLESADGQTIGYSESGVPFIDEPESPYHHMTIVDYRNMSEKWMTENHLRTVDFQSLTKELQVRKDGKKTKVVEPWIIKRADKFIQSVGDKFFHHTFMPKMSSRKIEEWFKKHDWPENPGWPEGIKTIDELEGQTKTRLRRKKKS